MTVCSCHVTYTFQSESTLYSCLNVKELLAQSRRKIWSLSDWNWTRTHNHLIHKRTLNYGWEFVYELSGCGFESSCMTLNGRDFLQRTRFFVSLLYLEIWALNFSIGKNVQYYWKCCLSGRRNRILKVLFQVCILKKSNYTHINSFVRTKHMNSFVIWTTCFFKVGAASYKSNYVKIKW